jgi:hypothetical protein
MRRWSPIALAFLVVSLAAPLAPAGARLPKPPEPVPRDAGVPGDYRGHLKTETFPSLAHPPRFSISFGFAGAEVRRLQTTLPLVCGEKELEEVPVVLDYEFGTRGTVGHVSPGGIFKVVEQARIAAAEAPAGSASVRAVIHGWFDGPEARGNYRFLSTDGSSCRGSGRWSADRVGP